MLSTIKRHLQVFSITGFTAAGICLVAFLVSRQNRQELLGLSIAQGNTLVEAISQILRSELAIAQERDRLEGGERRRTAALLWDQLPRSNGSSVAALVAGQRGASLIAVLDSDSSLTTYYGQGKAAIADLVLSAAFDLFRRPDTNYFTLSLPDTNSSEYSFYYLERSNNGREVLLLREDGPESSGSDSLIQWVSRLERDSSLLFLSWETPTRVIVSSSQQVAADSLIQERLVEASKGEEIIHQLVSSHGEDRLEFMRPFATTAFPLGVLRVALPLSSYSIAVNRADRQVFISALLALGVVVFGSIGLALRSRRREQEAAYESLRSLLGDVLNSLELGVVVIDETGVIRLANEWLSKRFGLQTLEGIPANSITELPLRGLSDGTRSTQLSVVDESGRSRWLQSTIVPLTLPSGQSGRLLFVHDRTELHEAEERIQRQERVAELGELAAGVAHDIRNPLHTISLGLQQLLQPIEPAHNVHESSPSEIIELLRKEVARINSSVTRFLSLTRVVPVESKRIDIREVLDERLAAWLPRAVAEQKRLTSSGPKCFQVLTDAARLRDILDNLIRNGIEAVSNQSGEIQMVLEATHSSWMIHIDDNGAGVSDEKRERLFSPGYTTKDSGTGIGMALVLKATRELRGEVTVGVSPLGGARVSLSFPIELEIEF